MNDQYPFKTYFTSEAHVVKAPDNELQVAKASIKDISTIFHDEEVIEKMQNNPDLLWIASPLCRASEANLNGDCVLASDLAGVYESFQLKFIDEEHSKDVILGAVYDSDFFLANSDIEIEDEQIEQYVNNGYDVDLVIGGYLWRLVCKELCQQIEESSALKDDKFSVSFEILFSEYKIGVSPTRKVNDGRIITQEDPEWESYNSKLKCKGGTGKDGELNVFRILSGMILPSGVGIVGNPASGIKGIQTVTPDMIKVEDEEGPETETEAELLSEQPIEKDNEINKVVEANINNENLSVTENKPINKTNLIMPTKIESVEDIKIELFKEEASASAVTEYIKKELEQKSVQYAQEVKAKEEEALAAEEKAKLAEAQVAELTTSVSALKEQLKELRAAQAAAEAQAAFSARMSALDDTFELDDEDRALMVDEIREIESDEAFAKFMDKNKKLMKEKTKDYKAKMKAKATETAAASKKEEVKVDEVIASVVEDKNQEISRDTEGAVSLTEQVRAAFGRATVVGGKQFSEK